MENYFKYQEKYLKYKHKYLELKDLIGGASPFKLNDTLTFINNRLKDHDIKLLDINKLLSEWVNKCRIASDPINQYLKIMNEIKELSGGGNIDWANLPNDLDQLKNLWGLRECIVSITFETASRIFTLNNRKKIQIAKKLPVRKIKNNKIAKANILGSTTLLSDIDITIESKNASTWIAIMEDLWVATKWFNHSKWNVDLYGDFTMIGEYYMDTRYFTKEILIEILKLAVISFFKHEHSDTFNIDLLKKLIKWCILNQGLLIDTDEIISFAKETASKIKLETRETYYKELKQSEILQENIATIIKKEKLNKNEINLMLGNLVIHLGKANLYREENYILPSTVIHVVKIEQDNNKNKYDCLPLLIKAANCSLSPFTYFLSAIEQLGYMLFNLHESGLKCSMSSGKYFGRLVRALDKALFDVNNISEIIKHNPKFKYLLDLANKLAIIKKERGDKGNLQKDCPENPDLYKLIFDLFKTF